MANLSVWGVAAAVVAALGVNIKMWKGEKKKTLGFEMASRTFPLQGRD